MSNAVAVGRREGDFFSTEPAPETFPRNTPPEMPHFFHGKLAQLTHRMNARRMQTRLHLSPNTRQFAYFHGKELLWDVLLTEHRQPVRFFKIACDLGEKTVRRQPDGTTQLGTHLLRNRAFDLFSKNDRGL